MILAGGTGGHIFPGLAVAEVLRARGVEVIWLGSAHGPENQWVPDAKIPFYALKVGGLRGNGLAGWLAAPFRLARAVRQASRLIAQLRPRAVLALGGFAAGPGGIAAWLKRMSLVVHEQNAVAGLTTKTLARIASRVLTAFPGVLPSAEVVGNPVRKTIAGLPPPAQRYQERTGSPRLLVLGGSQGARRINELLPEAVARMAAGRQAEVRHQCGTRHVDDCRQAYERAGVSAEVSGFLDDMAHAYGWADLVVARAGALTLSELAAAGVGALLVPYPHAVDDHQAANAAHFVAQGAARMVREEALDAAELCRHLEELTADRSELLRMAECARALAQPEAAERIADACLEV